MPAKEPLAKLIFCPRAALLVGEKCSCTPSTLRFFTSSRLALEQNLEFCKWLLRKIPHFRIENRRKITLNGEL